ncbi:MAG: hypothetical protein K2Y05_01205 [Hyphomicrobiaceae bacterium]|nr:hypothetical protein [Hyphomicrobiaceae bacterium]
MFLLEPAVARLLRPSVNYRPLPSLIFAVSSGVLAGSFTFCSTRRKAGIMLERRSELLSFLRNIGIYVGVFVVLFVVHVTWLGGAELFARAIQNDSSVSLLSTVLQTLLPLLVTGAIVGYCFNTALSEPTAVLGGAYNDPTASEWPHNYSWLDHSPRRPFRTWHQERSNTVLPVLVIYTLTGMVVGYLLWPQQWFGSALSCAALGLWAASGYATIVHWTYRHTDSAALMTTFVSRHAFVRERDGQLNFVVAEENGTPTGKIQIERPWAEVQEFSKDRYSAVFEETHLRPSTDWNVIKLVLTNSAPLLVSETFDGDGVVYSNVSRLAELFGPTGRERYMQARLETAKQPASLESVPQAL